MGKKLLFVGAGASELLGYGLHARVLAPLAVLAGVIVDDARDQLRETARVRHTDHAALAVGPDRSHRRKRLRQLLVSRMSKETLN